MKQVILFLTIIISLLKISFSYTLVARRTCGWFSIQSYNSLTSFQWNNFYNVFYRQYMNKLQECIILTLDIYFEL